MVDVCRELCGDGVVVHLSAWRLLILQGMALHRNVQRFRGGLVFKAHRLCVSLNARLEGNTEEEYGERGTDLYSSQSENNFFTEMCSGSEVGSYLRLIDLVHHSSLGLSVIQKKKKVRGLKQSTLDVLITTFFSCHPSATLRNRVLEKSSI